MQTSTQQFTRVGSVARYLIPVLLIFLIPGFSLWSRSPPATPEFGLNLFAEHSG